MTDAAERLSVSLAGRYRIERELGQGGRARAKRDRPYPLTPLTPELLRQGSAPSAECRVPSAERRAPSQ